MKKILIIIGFLFCAIFSFAQIQSGFPNRQVIANGATLYNPKGAVGGDSGLVNVGFVDTSAANFGTYIKNTNNIQIRVGDAIYFRDLPTYRWVKLGTSIINPATDCNRKVQGQVVWDSLLVFHSILYEYYIGCKHYFANPANFTLAPAFPANPRTDVWVVDTLGTIIVVTGDISGLAYQPNPASELEVAHAVIAAGATVPSGIFNTSIYKENIEWVGATNIPGTVFNYPTNPYAGDSSTYVPAFTNGQYITYQDMAFVNDHDITEVSFLKMYIRLNAPMTSGNLNFTFFNNLAAITTAVTLTNGQYGFNNTTVDSYQLIAIPISAWQLTGQGFNFNTLQIIVTGNGDSFQLDNIILQSGGGGTGGTGVNTFQGEDGSPPRNGNVIFRFTDDIHAINDLDINADTSFYYGRNSLGQITDSVWIAKNPLFATSPITITDTPTVRFGNPVRGYIIGLSGNPIFGTTRWSVRDSVSVPPVTPLDGSKFLVGTSPTGSFVGHANDIATYDSAAIAYTFEAPTIGDLLYDAANTMVSQWTGLAWVWVGHLVLYQGGNNFGQQYVFGSNDYNPVIGNVNTVRSISIGDSTTQNTSFGFGAGRNIPLQKNTSNGVREGNTNIGYKAGEKTTTASYNSALGMGALGSTTTGGNNTAVGKDALFSNTDGTNNTATGYFALRGNVSGVDNTAMGWNAMSGSNTGQGNTAIGKSALAVNTTGQLQVAVGLEALFNNTTGSLNTGIGRQSLLSNTIGSNNAGLGINTLRMNTTGDNNTGNGASAGFYNTTGASNTFIGYQSGAYILGGGLTNDIANSSIFIGANSRAQASNQTNQIVICPNCTGLGSNTTMLGDSSTTLTQIFGAQRLPTYKVGTIPTGTAVYSLNVDASGNVIGGTPGGGGGGSDLANFYLKDSSLSSDRTVDLNNKILDFQASTGDILKLDPIAFTSQMSAKDGSAVSSIILTGDSGGDNDFTIYSNNGTNNVGIIGNAVDNTLTYISGTHTFPSPIGSYNNLKIDAPNDTIALRLIHSTGAESSIKIGDNGTTPRITILAQDLPNGQSGEYIFQAGGFNFSGNNAVSDSRNVSMTMNAGGQGATYQNSTSGNSVNYGIGIEVGDHPYMQIYSQGTSDQSNATFKDTAINLYAPIVRLNTLSNGPSLTSISTGQLQFNQYGAGAFTGTPAFNLAVNSSGDIIEVSGGSSVSLTAGLGLTASPSTITGTGSYTLDTASSVVLSRQRAAATYAPISGGAYVSSTGTTGDINSYSATNTPSRIAAVASGQLFASAGTGTLPVWSASPSLSTSLTTPLLIGNTTSGGTLTLQSTSNGTKGKILFGTSAYDEVNNRLGIGTTTPLEALDVRGGAQFGDNISGWGQPLGSGFLTLAKTNALSRFYIGQSSSSYGYLGWVYNGTPSLAYMAIQSTFNLSLQPNVGNVGIGQTVPTAALHLKAGTATASTAPLKFTSGTNLTTPEAGAMEFLTDGYYVTTTTGAKRRFLAAATSGRSAAATAAVASVATYTLGASDASYEVSANVLVTTSSAEAFTVTCAYTDEGNTARTITLPFVLLAGTTAAAINFANGAVPYEGIPIHIRVKASTAITIATTGTFTGATYNVEGILKQTQ